MKLFIQGSNNQSQCKMEQVVILLLSSPPKLMAIKPPLQICFQTHQTSTSKMPRAQSTSPSPLARYDQGHSLTLTQVSIRHQLHVLSRDLLAHLRSLRLAAGLPLSPQPPPDSSGLQHQMVYTGLGKEAQDNVNGIYHPRFVDLGRVLYKVLVNSLMLNTRLISHLQKPVHKGSPIILWDASYIPRALLESDAELLRLLTERARLNAKWVIHDSEK